MVEFIHSKPRLFVARDISPSVHWAQHQQIRKTEGAYRRIYDFEIMYVSAGEMHVHYNEEDQPDIYRTGDLLFLTPGLRHRIELVSEPRTFLMGIHFDFYGELEMVTDQDMLVREKEVDDKKLCVLPVKLKGEALFNRRYPNVSHEISSLMEGIIDEFTTGKPGFEMICRGLMLQILTCLVRTPSGPERAIIAEYRKELQALANELEANVGNSWPNAVMARRCNVSVDHFIRLFKDMFGVSPQQYLLRMRHQEAKRLLRDTSLKIEHIGRLVGYEDLHNFSHTFKKWQGVSPREYRKLCNVM